MKKSISIYTSLIGKLILAVLVGVSLSLTSCKKDDDDNGNGGNPSDDTNFQLGAGTLVAVKSQTVQSTAIGDITIDIGTAVAVFGKDASWSAFVDGGTVKVNDKELEKFGNNSYVFTPGIADPTGITFGSSVDWSVSGNSGNGVPAFDHTVSGGFPSVGNVSVEGPVSKAEGVTVPITGVSNADSLYVNINEAFKVVASNATSANFSAADLSNVSTGTGIISIAAVRYTTADYSGKTFYFLTETVKQKTVEITN